MRLQGLRRRLFQLHLWIGILTGLYIAVVFTTGSALVYRIELQRTLDPHLFTPRQAGPLADPAIIMERVSRAYPEHRLSGVDAPTTARPTYLAYVTRGSTFVTVLIDPVSADVLGELPERSLVRILQRLHYDLFMDETGRIVHAIGAGCVLLMCVTGLIIWRASSGTLLRRAHRAIGIWTVAPIAVWAITGIYFVFPATIRSAVNSVSPLTVRRPPRSLAPAPAIPSAEPSWRAAIERAREHAPGRHVARVVVPSAERAPFLVMFAASSPTPVGPGRLTPIYLDRFTLDRLPEAPAGPRTAGDVVMAWLTPLHVGNFGGAPVKVAWVVLGFAPPVLFATGFIMWWTRVVRPRRAREAP